MEHKLPNFINSVSSTKLYKYFSNNENINLQHLEKLEIWSYCQEQDDVEFIFSRIKQLEFVPPIKSLIFDPQCLFTGNFLTEFINYFAETIVELDIKAPYNLPISSVKQLMNNCNNLTCISIGDNKMTEMDLAEIVSDCPLLKALDIRMCPHISDISCITNLNINHLNISCNNQLDGKMISNVVSELKLNQLSLANMNELSGDDILRICASCPHLTYLNLTKCNVNDDIINEIKVRCPNLVDIIRE